MNNRRLASAAALLMLPLLIGAANSAQSGRGTLHGYVGFEDISYNDVLKGGTHARVELHGATKYNRASYAAETDNRGSYDIPAIGMGEYTLTVSALNHATYQISIYIPSDFESRLAVMMKRK